MNDRCVAPRFLSRFRCTGGACEDSCCCRWRVPLNQTTYERIQEFLRTHPLAGSTEVLTRWPGKQASQDLYGQIVMREPGQVCPFLNDRRLCSLQVQHGAGALPTVCDQFPRTFLRVGSRLELAGTLACPETARLCLVDHDALELVDCEVDPDRRSDLDVVLETGSGNPYTDTFEEIRGLMVALLADYEFPVRTRLFFLAYASEHLSGFLSERSRNLDRDAYGDLLRRMTSPPYLTELAGQLDKLKADGLLAMTIVRTVLQSHALREPESRLSATLREVWRSFAIPLQEAKPGGKTKTKSFDPTLLELHNTRRRAWESAFSSAVDKYVTHLALSYLYAYPFIQLPDSRSFVRRLTVLIACTRFLLFAHPALQGLEPSEESCRAVAEEALQRAAVDSAFLLARSLTHDRGMTKTLEQELDRQGIRRLAHSVQLLQL